MAGDNQNALLAVGGLLVVGTAAWLALRKPKEEGPAPGFAEYKGAVAQYIGQDTWYGPRQNIPLYPGADFAAKLTFQHRGLGETVLVIFRIDTHNLAGAGEYQYSYSPYKTLLDDEGWKTYTIETALTPFSNPNQLTGWNLRGDVILNTQYGEQILLVPSESIYTTAVLIGAAEYRSAEAEYWG